MNYIYIFLLFIFIISCLTVAYYQYKSYIKTVNKKNKYVENNEFVDENHYNTNGDLFFFYTKWCPYCKESIPIWNDLSNKQKFKKFNLNFIKIDCEDKDSQTYVERFDIKEYPSIILFIDGKKYIYDANLSEDTLYRFLIAVYEKIDK
jgi:thiol-disulfide isomerase/thioredoxin